MFYWNPSYTFRLKKWIPARQGTPHLQRSCSWLGEVTKNAAYFCKLHNKLQPQITPSQSPAEQPTADFCSAAFATMQTLAEKAISKTFKLISTICFCDILYEDQIWVYEVVWAVENSLLQRRPIDIHFSGNDQKHDYRIIFEYVRLKKFLKEPRRVACVSPSTYWNADPTQTQITSVQRKWDCR